MARRTSDTTIWDEDEDYSLRIDSEQDAHIKSKIWDGITEVKISASGELQVTSPSPAPPTGTTAIAGIYQGNVSGTDDQFLTIPNGETITIQRFKAGAANGNGGSKVELYYAPNGNTTDIVLIEAIYVNQSSFFVDLNYVTAIGNGTRAILVRRFAFLGGSREIFGKWEGFY